MKKLEVLPFSYALAGVSAMTILFLGVFGNFGFYMGGVEMMSRWHMFFSLSSIGILTGVIEAVIISFLFGYIFATLYNHFVK